MAPQSRSGGGGGRRGAGAWYAEGLPFACTQCGKCCRSRGDHQYVYVNARERRALASFLGMGDAAFTRAYTTRDENGYRTLRFKGQACVFLDGNLCRVHEVKPVQCRTWPFWKENLESPEAYEREVRSFCPGSRAPGPVIPATEVRRQMEDTEAAGEED